MKVIWLSIVLIVLCVPGAIAHPEYTILEYEDAVSDVKYHLINLVTEKKLPETWADAEPDLENSKVEVIHGKRR